MQRRRLKTVTSSEQRKTEREPDDEIYGADGGGVQMSLQQADHPSGHKACKYLPARESDKDRRFRIRQDDRTEYGGTEQLQQCRHSSLYVSLDFG